MILESGCRWSGCEASTRTVADAATAVGCDEAEIAKSIVFVADGDPSCAWPPAATAWT